jgi:hypothetical protein
MSSGRSRKGSRGSRSRPAEYLQKPRGVLHPRVQKVGPEHFGIVCIDPAKERSKWMLCDFYGKVWLPPEFVAHNRPELENMVARVRAAMEQHELHDLIVAVERTGRYHHPVKNIFAAGGFDTRLVHPYATKQFRQPADPNTNRCTFPLEVCANATILIGGNVIERVRYETTAKRRCLLQVFDHLLAAVSAEQKFRDHHRAEDNATRCGFRQLACDVGTRRRLPQIHDAGVGVEKCVTAFPRAPRIHLGEGARKSDR